MLTDIEIKELQEKLALTAEQLQEEVILKEMKFPKVVVRI